MEIVKPQPGPQEDFLCSSADIAIIGGANDGGKTFALLMESLYHSENPGYEAVYFRRITSEITNAGGLWREARKLYHNVEWRESPRMQVTFPKGAVLTFSHMEHSSDRFAWDGSQIAGLFFDQLESFEEEQFWHLVGRNRSTCGVEPFVRASMNPKPKHWSVNFIQWWWDPETGYPIPERSGVLRWFVRDPTGNEIYWADSPEKLAEFKDPRTGETVKPKSVTFIFATVYDNKIALALDPGRLTNLLQLPLVERERRLRGNMKIEDISGEGLIKPEWWVDKIIEPNVWNEMQSRPKEDWTWKRGWDLAAGDSSGADYTVGALIGKHKKDGRRIIADIKRGRWSPLVRNEMIKNTIIADQSLECLNYIWRPTMNTDMHKSVMNAIAGLPHQFVVERGSKLFRAQSWSPQVEAGNYYLVRADWNLALIEEGAKFDGEPSTATKKDDIVDAVCLADQQHTRSGN